MGNKKESGHFKKKLAFSIFSKNNSAIDSKIPEKEPNLHDLTIGVATIASEDHRYRNEDGYLFKKTEPVNSRKKSSGEGLISVVFDGVGGGGYGAEATSTAVNYLNKTQIKTPSDETGAREIVESIINGMHKEVISKDKKLKLPPTKYAATTCAGVLIWYNSDNKPMVTYFNVGDPRVYLYRKELYALTLDQIYPDKTEEESWDIQSRLSQATKFNDLSPEDQAFFKKRNLLQQMLGQRGEVIHGISTVELLPGDRLVLVTDGVYDPLPDSQIKKLLVEYAHPQQAAEELIKASVSVSKPALHIERKYIPHIRAKPDDSTALVINFGEGVEPPKTLVEDDHPLSISSIKKALIKPGLNLKVKVKDKSDENGPVFTAENFYVIGLSPKEDLVGVINSDGTHYLWVNPEQLRHWNHPENPTSNTQN